MSPHPNQSNMGRITYQLIPKGGASTEEITVNLRSNVVDTVSEDQGFKQVHFKDDSSIKIGELGNIRYSKKVKKPRESIQYSEIYREFIERASAALNSKQTEYSLCLILHSDDVFSMYTEQKEHILRFLRDEFNIAQTDFSDLGDRSMKVSISSQKNYVNV